MATFDPFAGDIAADTLSELEEEADPGMAVRILLQTVLREQEGFLSSGEAESGLTAACLVAAASLPDSHVTARRWLAETGFEPDDEHGRLARSMLDRVLNPENNELYRDWKLTGE